MHRNYDLVLCGGPATVKVFAEAFRVREDQVKPLGLPRVDHLLRHASDATAEPVPPYVSELRRRFPLLAEHSRRTVLYAPTFRRNRPDHYREVIERFAGEGYTVIVKPHPLVTADVSGANVVNACGVDVLELLPLSDVVITDYSAVAFEAAVLDKPLYFYVFDIDEYLDRARPQHRPALGAGRCGLARSRRDRHACRVRDLRLSAARVAQGALRLGRTRRLHSPHHRRDLRPPRGDRPMSREATRGRLMDRARVIVSSRGQTRTLRSRCSAKDRGRRTTDVVSTDRACAPGRPASRGVQGILRPRLRVQPPRHLRGYGARPSVR